MPIIAFAIMAFQHLPEIIAAGKDVAAFVEHAIASLKNMQAEGRDPTAAEWDELNAQIAALRARLHSDDK